MRIIWIFMSTLLIEVIIMTLLPTLAFAQASGGDQKASSPIAAALAVLTLLVGLAKAIFEYASRRNEKVATPSQEPLTLRLINNSMPEVGLSNPKIELFLWAVGSFLASLYFFVLGLFLLDSLSDNINIFLSDKYPSMDALQKGILYTGIDALFWVVIVVLFFLGCAALAYAVGAFWSYMMLENPNMPHIATVEVGADRDCAMSKCITILKELRWYITDLDSDKGEIKAMKINTTFYIFSHSGKTDTCMVQIEEQGGDDKKRTQNDDVTQNNDVKGTESTNAKCSVITVRCDGVGVRPNFESNKKRNRRHVRQFVAQLIG